MQIEQLNTTKKKKKWVVLGILALILIVAAINIVVMQKKEKGSSNDIIFANASEKELTNTKLVAGRISPGNLETNYADPSKGKFKEMFVKEGQEVTKGQKLFSYDNPELSIQLKQLEIDKKSVQMRFDQGKEKIASLQKEIQKAKSAGSAKDILDPLETQLQDLQFQQQTTQLEIEKNKLQEEDLQNKQNDLIVYSNTDGVVQKADKDAGQNGAQAAGALGSPIIQIASKDPFVITGTLTELQKSQILPNQSIKVTAKAAANKTWTGKITNIEEYPVSDGTEQSVPVVGGQQSQNISYYNFKAALDSQDGLSPGYHVSIQINLSSKKMLVVPSSCIVEKGDSRYVYVVKKNKLHKQTVTTGMEDGESLEVIVGLKAGDKVVKNPSANVHDGLDVKVK